MNSARIESIVADYAANKEEADRLTARNAELAEEMLGLAEFAPGSDTGRLTAAGYKVSVTRRIAVAVARLAGLTDSDSGIVGWLSRYLTAVSIRNFLRRNGRSNEKWDQHLLSQARETLTDNLFFTLFRQEFKPDRRALRAFMHGGNDARLKALLISACTTSAGKSAVRLEKLEAAQ